MWQRFVTNNFRFSLHDPQYRHAYIINTAILLSSLTLLFFCAYNVTVTGYYELATIELVIFLLFVTLLLYFHKSSNIRVTSYGILLLLFAILAAYIEIIGSLEYSFYWLAIFPPVAIFLLGRKAGLIACALFFGYFLSVMISDHELWMASTFNTISIVNIIIASIFIVTVTAYFDLSRDEASDALAKQTRMLEEEHAMLDRYVPVYTFDHSGVITYISNAFCDISGYCKDEIIGKDHHMLYHSDTDPALTEEMLSAISNGKAWTGEIKCQNKGETYYWMHTTVEPIQDAEGHHRSYRAIGEDITDRKQVEALAISDYLTKLYNRSKIDDALSKELLRAERYAAPLCVTLLDIDHFKNVNDTYGHQMGDTVLKQIAQILRSNTRNVDTLGRWGGEEFMIVMPSTGINDGTQVAEKLRANIANHDFGEIGTQTASFGVAEYRQGDSLDSLIDRVDKALYRAKNNGRNRVSFAQDKNG